MSKRFQKRSSNIFRLRHFVQSNFFIQKFLKPPQKVGNPYSLDAFTVKVISQYQLPTKRKKIDRLQQCGFYDHGVI